VLELYFVGFRDLMNVLTGEHKSNSYQHSLIGLTGFNSVPNPFAKVKINILFLSACYILHIFASNNSKLHIITKLNTALNLNAVHIIQYLFVQLHCKQGHIQIKCH